MIKVDKDLCIGCGACEALCPHNFKINNEGKAEVVSQDLNPCAREAEESCPVNAIKIE